MCIRDRGKKDQRLGVKTREIKVTADLCVVLTRGLVWEKKLKPLTGDSFSFVSQQKRSLFLSSPVSWKARLVQCFPPSLPIKVSESISPGILSNPQQIRKYSIDFERSQEIKLLEKESRIHAVGDAPPPKSGPEKEKEQEELEFLRLLLGGMNHKEDGHHRSRR